MRPLFFDVDGVLVHGYHANPEKQIRWDETIEQDLGIDRARFSEEFFARDFLSEVIVGRKDLKVALQAWLSTTDYRVTAEGIVSYWLEKDSNMDRDLLSHISKIKEVGVPLFVATNQEHYRAQYLWDVCGFKDFFDDIFYSARLGVMKPDPLYFQKIDELVANDTEHPLFFDDRIEVVEAAQAHGWEAVVYETIDDVLGHPYIKGLLTD